MKASASCRPYDWHHHLVFFFFSLKLRTVRTDRAFPVSSYCSPCPINMEIMLSAVRLPLLLLSILRSTPNSRALSLPNTLLFSSPLIPHWEERSWLLLLTADSREFPCPSAGKGGRGRGKRRSWSRSSEWQKRITHKHKGTQIRSLCVRVCVCPPLEGTRALVAQKEEEWESTLI